MDYTAICIWTAAFTAICLPFCFIFFGAGNPISTNSSRTRLVSNNELAWYLHHYLQTAKQYFDTSSKHLDQQDVERADIANHIFFHLSRIEAKFEELRKDTKDIFSLNRRQTGKINGILSTQRVHTNRFDILYKEIQEGRKSFDLSELKTQLERIEHKVDNSWTNSWGAAGDNSWDNTGNNQDANQQQDNQGQWGPWGQQAESWSSSEETNQDNGNTFVYPQEIFLGSDSSLSSSDSEVISSSPSPLRSGSTNPLLSDTRVDSPPGLTLDPVHTVDSILSEAEQEGNWILVDTTSSSNSSLSSD